jgi:hypothetical protein
VLEVCIAAGSARKVPVVKTSSGKLTAAVVALLLCSAAGPLSAQLNREPSDVYEFAPPLEFKPRYEHPEGDRNVITNADFFCTACAKEGRIPFKSRNELKDVLEMTQVYTYPLAGKKSEERGAFRLLEHDAELVLEHIFDSMRCKNPIFIEDKVFRLVTDFEEFSTKKEPYPRREIELEQLADVFPEVSKKTVVLNPHQRAHLYLIRAHRVMRDFDGLVEYNPRASYFEYIGPYHGMKQKYEIFVFDKRKNIAEIAAKFLGHTYKGYEGECWHTLKDDSMCALMHCENFEDFQTNNTFTHRLSYNLLQSFRGYVYDLPAWIQLGYGHLMERRERTDHNTFFHGEGLRSRLHVGAKWKVPIRKLVVADKVRPFAEIATFENITGIPVEERPIVWSMVSYLMQLDQKKMGKFIHVLKDKKKGESVFNLQVRAFQVAFGVSMTQFFENWKQWVLDTYPTV